MKTVLFRTGSGGNCWGQVSFATQRALTHTHTHSKEKLKSKLLPTRIPAIPWTEIYSIFLGELAGGCLRHLATILKSLFKEIEGGSARMSSSELPLAVREPHGG